MSKETKTKEKIDMDPKYITKLTVTLLLTCIIVAGLLGLVNSVTAGPIAQKNKEKTEAAMLEVVADPASTFSDALELTTAMTDATAAAGGTLDSVYEVQMDGTGVGYAVKVIAGGSQGDIQMMVGVDVDGIVTGVSIIKNAETSGIGSKVMKNENGVLDQFVGKSAADGALTVGVNVDAITGATVSTRGVTNGVNAALAAVAAIG